ncbi:MAG: TIGR04211 family SH3 domain-containing protein [Syntrophobacteraceae bacterium]
MRKSFFTFIWVISATFVIVSGVAWGTQAYVAGTREIALRSGPSTRNRVIGMLQPSYSVEVLKTLNDWSLVRVSNGLGSSKDGWVLSSFLGTGSPEQQQIRGLEAENASLKERTAALEKEKSELIQREKELTEKVNKLQSDYETLKSGSTNYLDLKEENDSLRIGVATLKETNRVLARDNENLKLTQKLKWFLLGAAVLLCGWFLGIVSGKQRRKKSPSYHL